MSNFVNLVTNILLEVDNPQTQTQAVPAGGQGSVKLKQLHDFPQSTFKNLKEVFDKKFGMTTDLNQLYNELNNTVPGGKYNIAAKYVNDTYIPYIDAFSLGVKQMTSDQGADQKPTMDAILDEMMNKPQAYNSFFDQVSNAIQTMPVGDRPIDYYPVHPNVSKAANTLRSETEKLAQTAIESLYNDPIFEGVSKIIAKRTNVFDRIGKLKGIRRPFSSTLIRPILTKYRNYISLGEPGRDINWEKVLAPLYGNWQKKISGDFNAIVDNVTSDNLLTIAVLAGEYYLSLLRNVVLSDETKENEPVETQMELPLTASLNLFDRFVGDILNEVTVGSTAGYRNNYSNIFGNKKQLSNHPEAVRSRARRAAAKAGKQQTPQQQTQQQTQQQNQTPAGATPLTQKEYDDIARGLGSGEQADHANFITKGKSNYLGETIYNIGTIAKDPSNQAKSLIKAIKNIAFHVNKKPGVGDRLDGLNKGLQGIWAMSGHRLYN